VRAGLCFDQLNVNAHPIFAALDAAFEHVAHVEVAPDSLEIGRLCPCRKRRSSVISCASPRWAMSLSTL
jgi:hypothetical protein